MIDLILAGVILALLLYMTWEQRERRREHAKLINAIVSKTPEQMRDLEFVDKVQVPKIEKPQVDEFIDPNNLSDDKWQEVITEGV